MSTIKKVTVIGSGTMGHGIAQISAMAGYNISIRDVEQKFLDSAIDKIKWSLEKLLKKQKITDLEMKAILERIHLTTDLNESLSESDLVIEAVPEDLILKKRVYEGIDENAEDKTLYASNTSTLPITEIASLTSRPERFVGLHFFNPPQLMQLVEVIPGKETSPKVVETTVNFIESLGKQPILCRKDVPGFIVNRIFIPLVHEAAYCLERDKTNLVAIDSAVKEKMNFPMGIFELADYTGLDVIHKATVEMYSRDKDVMNPNPNIERLFSEGKYGQKSGQGFYEYKKGQYERVNLANNQVEKYDPVKLVAFAANNAGWLISHGACDKNELETALRLGMGLKAELFETVKSYGVESIINTLRQLAKENGDIYEPDQFLINHLRS
ncbi:MAG TPA: 3-hydroxyacyl-CoA dehydrogenase family protein [Nitrososphaeraceae archaeon]